MHTALLELTSPVIPDARTVMRRAGSENFPVAARVLAREDRRHLLAVYGFARLTDELGDELSGDRLAALDWLEEEVQRAYSGQARHPLLRALQATIAECELPRGPLLRLIEANRVDQRVTRYETWRQLRAYCELSANPVGELVLHAFGLADHERIALSDSVCTALQLVEHLQDVREDMERGRVYLPAEDLARFDCSREDFESLLAAQDKEAGGGELHGVHGNGVRARGRFERLRGVVEFECARARDLLRAGEPLVASVPGRPKLALAAFVSGGHAALQAIERRHFDVLDAPPRASRARRARSLMRVLARSRRVERHA
jgi:squalene synthase HpnC